MISDQPATIPLDYAAPPRAAEPPSRPAARLDYVDGLRGLAILIVFLYHSWQYSGNPSAHWWNPLRSGFIGVNLFLVISGFCLYWPMVKSGGAPREPTLRQFAWRRARRILPPYWTALAAFTVLWLVTPRFGISVSAYDLSPRELLRSAGWHALMVHNLRPDHIWLIDSSLWSLPLEVNLYLAMPILVIFARRFGIFRAVVLASTITVAYRLGIYIYLHGKLGTSGLDYESGFALFYFFLGRWMEFALGMWCAVLTSQHSHRRSPQVLVALSALFIVGGIALTDFQSFFSPFNDICFGIGFFFLLLSAADARGPVSRFLRWKPLVLLGTISYSLYLLHDPLLALLTTLIQNHVHRHVFIFAICVSVFFPAILGLTTLFYLLAERPFIGNPRVRAARDAELLPATAINTTGSPRRDEEHEEPRS